MENPESQHSPKAKQSKWLSDYVFWRDIVTTAIGGTLVLVIAFLWATFMGYLAKPEFWNAVGSFFGAVSWTVGPILTVLGLVMMIYFRRAKLRAIERL